MPLRWVWACFGVLFVIAGIISIAYPEDTFAGLADMLGFLFLAHRPVVDGAGVPGAGGQPALVARAHRGRPDDHRRFWTAGQFFIEKAYVLLVFAGIWALMEGIADISRAFAVRGLHEAA